MQTTEGRVVKSSDRVYTYEYYLRDHLGSVRVRFSKGDNQQASLSGGVHYYPFGMIIGGLSEETEGTTDHLFGGKRLLNQDLGGTQANWYDFGARNYDAQLGMWFNVDPMAEKYVSHTPYNYCFGNPINFVDPTGMEPDNYKPWYWNEDVHGKWSWFDNYREGLYTTDFYFRTGNDAGISSRGLLDASIAMYGENSDYAQWYDSGAAGNWDDIKGKGGYFVWEYDRSRGRSSKWEAVVAYKKTWVSVAQADGVPDGYQYSYTLELELKGSAGLQIGLSYLLGKEIGGVLAGPGIEGTRTVSLVYLATDDKFQFTTEGVTKNFDYNMGISVFDLFGISKTREYGIYKSQALDKQTIVNETMYMSEINKVNGVYDPTSWQMKFGAGVDVRVGVGVAANISIIIGYSPLLNP